MTKTQKERLAAAHGVHVRFIYQLLAGDRFTTAPGLALDLAKFTGEKPITYFNERLHRLALSAHPELNEVITKSHRRKVAVQR